MAPGVTLQRRVELEVIASFVGHIKAHSFAHTHPKVVFLCLRLQEDKLSVC